jgi:hypothetical protein
METLADRYDRLLAEMQKLRSGDALASAADAVQAALPRHSVVLVSTSDEGAGVAAVCAARRGRGTNWMKVDLLAPQQVADGPLVVVVEPVDAGAAWRQAVERVYPGARILVVGDLLPTVAVAA